MPDRRETSQSSYTADRNIPGAFEGETVTRRRFMTELLEDESAARYRARSVLTGNVCPQCVWHSLLR